MFEDYELLPKEMWEKAYWNNDGIIGEFEDGTELTIPYHEIYRCSLCGYIGQGFSLHHTKYRAPETVCIVCSDCHSKIHHKDGYYDELEPDTKRSEAIEQRHKPLRNMKSAKVVTPGDYDVKEGQRRRWTKSTDS